MDYSNCGDNVKSTIAFFTLRSISLKCPQKYNDVISFVYDLFIANGIVDSML